jgi:chitodextrinase
MVRVSEKDDSLVHSARPFAKVQLLLVVAAVVASSAYVVAHIYAASGIISLSSNVASVNIGDMVSVSVHENSGTDPVNSVQANVGFDATRLQYVGVDDTGSGFGLIAKTTNNNGFIELTRAVQGGTASVTGNQLVSTIMYRAIAAGSVPLSFTAGTVLVRTSDTVDILAVKNGLTLNLLDLSAPTQPTGATVTAANVTSVGLSWNASTDNVAVAGYKIYRDGNQVGTVNSPSSLSYTDTNLSPNTTYSYTVAAVDTSAHVSAQSSAVAGRTLADTAAPSTPGTPVSSGQTMTSITLSWSSSLDNVGVAGYRVYRNTVLVGSPVSTSLVDPSLVPGTSYSYTVAAIDAAGNLSQLSPHVSVQTLVDSQPPTVPTNLSGTVSGQNIVLTWVASTDNVGVSGYLVSRDGVQIATSVATGYTVTGAPVGSHTYSVVAVDAAGNKSPVSNIVTLSRYLIGDINHDAKVDIFDLSILLNNWNRAGANSSDLNGDSVVNVFDLSILLAHWAP